MPKPLAFEKYCSMIEAELRASIGANPLPLYDMLQYHLGWVDAEGRPVREVSGKYLRPTLCLSSCLAAGGEPTNAVAAAAALELVHNFSLVHDDIQDKSDYRRHRPTVWKVWGVAQAIDAGDSMYALAQLEVLRLCEKGVPPERVVGAARMLGQACRSLCEGQFLDIRFESQPDVSVDEYMEMVSGKTAALISASASIGALVASGDARVAGCMSSFGKHLGIAFQIRDDILGIWEDPGHTGKTRFEDIFSRKKTLPVIYGMARAAGSTGERLSSLYRRVTMTLEDAEEIASILDQNGARSQATSLVEQHKRLAINELASAPNQVGVQELMDIVDFVLTPMS